MCILISISLALLVIVAGMLLLAKTKKDDLGGIYKFVSYAVITVGILMASFSFVSCIVKCQSGGCGSSSKASCYKNYHGNSGKCASWGKSCSGSSCSGKSKSCRSKCSKGKDRAGCSKKSSCKKGGAWRKHKNIITETAEGDTIDVQIEITEE